MNIWLVTKKLPPHFSGAGKNEVLLATYLSDVEDINIGLITSRHCHENKYRKINGLGVTALCDGESIIRKLAWSYMFIWQLYKAKAKPHVVRFRGYNISYALTIFFLRMLYRRIKIVVQPACLGVDDPLSVKKKKMGWLQFSQMMRAHAVFSMNQKISNLFFDNGYENSRVYPIKNIINLQKYKKLSGEEKQSLRHKYNLQCETLLLTVGIFDPRKKQSFITESFCQAYPLFTSKNIKLVHIGPTLSDLDSVSRKDRDDTVRSEQEKVEAIIREYAMHEQVILLGHQSDMANLIGAGDILIHASELEGESNVVNEAMACGVCVVVPHSDVYSRQLDTSCGNMFEAGNVSDLKNKLIDMVNNKEETAKRSSSAYERIRRERIDSVIINEYLDYFKSI